jgi:hypothetical protein
MWHCTNADSSCVQLLEMQETSRGWQMCCSGPAGHFSYQSKPSQNWLGTPPGYFKIRPPVRLGAMGWSSGKEGGSGGWVCFGRH